MKRKIGVYALVVLASTSFASSYGTVAKPNPPIAPFARHVHSRSGENPMQSLLKRFPGASVLGDVEFAASVQGRLFSYREDGGDLIIDRPKEVFREGGRYELHGLRAISRGTYSLQGGVVTIECPEEFLGLEKQRVFFRQEGRLVMSNASGEGPVFELIDQQQ